jgi:hypothetical protein
MRGVPVAAGCDVRSSVSWRPPTRSTAAPGSTGRVSPSPRWRSIRATRWT